MSRHKSLLLPVVPFVGGALLAVMAMLVISRMNASPDSIRSAGPTIKQVQELADLIVLRLQVADVLYNEDDNYARIAILVRGDCDLVIDLDEALILERNSENQTARIKLPLPKPTRPRVDHERTKLYKVERTGFFWFLNLWDDPRGRLYEECMKEAQKLVEFHSSKKEEQARAMRHAESVITLFFQQFEWRVEVQWDQGKS